MEPLTWTGSLGGLIVPIVQFGLIALLVGIVGSFTAVFATSTQPVFAPGGAVITPWRPTTASSLAELILPGIVRIGFEVSDRYLFDVQHVNRPFLHCFCANHRLVPYVPYVPYEILLHLYIHHFNSLKFVQ